MDAAVILGGAGVIVAAVGVAATLIIWALKGVFDLGRLNAKVDTLDEKNDVQFDAVNEKVDALEEKIDVKIEALDNKTTARIDALESKTEARFDALEQYIETRFSVQDAKIDALSDRIDRIEAKIDAMQADMRQVINMMTALANHRHDVDGNTVFNVPPNPVNTSNS